MTWLLGIEEIQPDHLPVIGGKALVLGLLHRSGFCVPDTLCITTTAYDAFLDHSGLRERILLEFNRKSFEDMRWEEIWDCATRIRNMFLKAPMPPELETALTHRIQHRFGEVPVAVRSTAPEEDAGAHSFAGIHESVVNVRGRGGILQALRKVWASLWSDAAMLYRRELNLDVSRSAMAVLVQEMIYGSSAGVMFTVSPADPGQAVIEAVHGLNQALVDGQVPPDRWLVDRRDGRIVSHEAPMREKWLAPDAAGETLEDLPPVLRSRPPLSEDEVRRLYEAGRNIEAHRGAPQDIEFAMRQDGPVILQARPISTVSDTDTGDARAWYLSLHRSHENLLALKHRIENRFIPDMQRVAAELASVDLAGMNDTDLMADIQRRWDINNHWVHVYWTEFIPFAHGMRLFGQMYNEIVGPADPYEFMALLINEPLVSMSRNRALEEMADMLRERSPLRRALERGSLPVADADFMERYDAFVARYGDLSCSVTGAVQCTPDPDTLINMLLELSAAPARRPTSRGQASPDHLESMYLDHCPPDKKDLCASMLDIARASYRLRDDDNIYLGAIEARLVDAVQEARRRIHDGTGDAAGLHQLLETLNLEQSPDLVAAGAAGQAPASVRARQLVGQPAGPGLCRGTARVVASHSDLADFKNGDILVCDAIDPNMTFVVALASGIIERRGGMLIHGAIIAREYGIPCVTGIAEATRWIHTGDSVTVDGYLGIVTIHRESDSTPPV